jgi:hypothetical protein
MDNAHEAVSTGGIKLPLSDFEAKAIQNKLPKHHHT